MTPLAYFDTMLDATGRIDLPLSSTALYQFLPIRWGTIGHAGVEFENLVYDARCLDAFRSVRKGQFRDRDRAMPFFYDPHDVSRVWWSDPDTGLVHEVPWRGAAFLEAPMTDLVLDSVRTRIKDRGGNLALNLYLDVDQASPSPISTQAPDDDRTTRPDGRPARRRTTCSEAPGRPYVVGPGSAA